MELIDLLWSYLKAHRVESLGAVLTVICVWLNTRQNIWGWIVGIASILCYIYVFYDVYLFGDFLLNIYFLILSLYGWYNWQFGSASRQTLPVSQLSRSELALCLTGGAVFAAVMGFLLQKYTEASLPYWDATTTAYSVIAQWLLARKKLENWLFWIFINVLCVGIYYVKDLTATAILYFVLLLIAIKGYAQWREGMFKQPQAAIA